jgi:hypothetical protein
MAQQKARPGTASHPDMLVACHFRRLVLLVILNSEGVIRPR